jgi:hypothetical protein
MMMLIMSICPSILRCLCSSTYFPNQISEILSPLLNIGWSGFPAATRRDSFQGLFSAYITRRFWIIYGFSGQARLPERKPEAAANSAFRRSLDCPRFNRLTVVAPTASTFVCHGEMGIIQNDSRQARSSSPAAVRHADGSHVLSKF